MATFDFSGRDLITTFDEDTRNVGVKGYRLRYVMSAGEIIHTLAQESFQVEDVDEIRTYQDTLTYEEIASKGLTRTVQVYLSTLFSDGLYSAEANVTAVNPPPSTPAITYGLGDTFINITLANTSDDRDFVGYVVWADTDPNASYTTAAFKAKGAGPNFTLDVEPDTQYRIQYAAYDAFGDQQLNVAHVDLKSLTSTSNVLPLIEEAIRPIEEDLAEYQEQLDGYQNDLDGYQQDIEEYQEDIGELIIEQGTAADEVTRAFRDDAVAQYNLINQVLNQQDTNIIEQIQGVSSAFDEQLNDLDATIGPRINAAVSTETSARTSAIEALATQVQLIGSKTDSNTAAIAEESQTRTTADQAEANARTQLQTRVGTAEGRITNIQNTIAGFTYAETTTVNQQVSQLNNDLRSVISTTNTTRVNAEEAIGRRVDAVQSTVGNVDARVTSVVNTQAGVNSSLSQRIDTVQSTTGAVDSRVTSVVNTQAGVNSGLSQRIDQVSTTIGNVDARVTNVVNTQAGVDSAQSQRIEQVSASVGSVDARVTSVVNTQAGTNNALSQRIDQVSASTGAVDARVTTVVNSQAGVNSGLSQRIDSVSARLNGGGDINAAINNEAIARVQGDQAQANLTNQVKARLDNLNGATIEQQFATIAQTNGNMAASYVLKTEVTSNGRRVVGGFGLLNDGNSTEFAVRANRFLVSDDGGNTGGFPFEIVGGRTRIRDAYITNANIDNATLAGEKLVPNAISMSNEFKYLRGYDNRDGIGTGGFTPYMSASIQCPNVPGGTRVRIDVACECSGGDDGKSVWFYMLRSDGMGTNQVRMTVPDEDSAVQNWFWTDTIPYDGSWSYQLYARCDAGFRYRNLALAGLIQKR